MAAVAAAPPGSATVGADPPTVGSLDRAATAHPPETPARLMGAVPPDAWGRPPRLAPDRSDPGPVVDLRDRPGGFAPSPPPPPPPPRAGSRGPRPGLPGRRAGRRRLMVETAAGLVVLVLFATLGRPPAAPPGGAWAARSAPVVVALARDVSAAAARPTLGARDRAHLSRDLSRARGLMPDDPGAARHWRSALADVRAALAGAATDPGAAVADLRLAGLELTAVGAAGAARGGGAVSS